MLNYKPNNSNLDFDVLNSVSFWLTNLSKSTTRCSTLSTVEGPSSTLLLPTRITLVNWLQSHRCFSNSFPVSPVEPNSSAVKLGIFQILEFKMYFYRWDCGKFMWLSFGMSTLSSKSALLDISYVYLLTRC